FLNNNSFDSCGIDSLVLSQYDFNCADIDSQLVTLRVRDVNGNQNICNTWVIVVDTFPPILHVKNDTLYLDANGNAQNTVFDLDSATFDVCALDSLWASQTSFDCSDIPSTVVKVKAFDVYGNVDSALTTVFVIDTIKPNALCHADTTIWLNASGQFTITEDYLNNISFDSCGIDSLVLSKYNFNCADIDSQLVTLRVRDVNGNQSTCNTWVMVVDTFPPILHLKTDTLYLDANGNAQNTVFDVDSATFDVCALDSMWASQTSFDCSDIPSTVVKVKAFDIYGNVDSALTTVVVIDTVKPVALCHTDTTIWLNTGGQFT